MAVARFPVAFIAVALIGTVLWDAFEAIVLPRRVTRRWRLARLFYRLTWSLWAAVARRIGSRARRESFLGVFGPLSLLFLLALWAASLVLGFGALHWSLATTLHTLDATETFKQNKQRLIRERFDPSVVGDPLFFRDPATGDYRPINRAVYARIVEGGVRF